MVDPNILATRPRTLLLALTLIATFLFVPGQSQAAIKCLGKTPTILGTPGDDTLNGTAGPDIIQGGAGHDTIEGLGGDDLLCGGKGKDIIRGGAGNDRIDGGPGDDRIFGNTGNDNLRGRNGADRILGGGGADVLAGGAHDDVLKSGAGDDRLNGGKGDNKLFGGANFDLCRKGRAFSGCEGPSPKLTMTGAPAGLVATVAGVLDYITDPGGNAAPPLAPGLRQHLRKAKPLLPLTVDASVVTRTISGTQIAVVADQSGKTAGSDGFMLLVESAGTWKLVGLSLDAQSVGPWFGRGPRYVAILGSDDRPADGREWWLAQGDSVHILATDGEGSGAIIGVPRDTFLEVPYQPTWNGNPIPGTTQDEISWTMRRGPAMTTQVLADMSGFPIEGYLATQFGGGLSDGSGFTELIEGLGGLTIDLPFDIQIFGPAEDFIAGLQSLDGARALVLARERMSQKRGDMDRTYHQGLIIDAALRQVQALGPLVIPDMLDLLLPLVMTDLSVEDVFTLVGAGFHLDPDQVFNLTLPASNFSQDLVSGVVPCDSGTVFCRTILLLDNDKRGGIPTRQTPCKAEPFFRDLDDGIYDAEAEIAPC